MQITLDPDLQRRARKRVSKLGVSFAKYVRQLIARDLGERPVAPDVSAIFDLVKDGERTDIARDKDRMIGEAVIANYDRKTKRGSVRR
jgi:hypothetical protein